MPDIVLTTLNAKYIHAAFGLRYLLANLGPLQNRARIVEFDINQRPLDVAEVLLAQNPRIIGIGVYIWNVAQATQVVAALKQIRPDIAIVIGGPEVSHETDDQEIVRLADHVITGEADLKFAEVCGQLLAGDKPTTKIIPAPLPECSQLELPYEFYNDQDIAHRIIYVEASRGCPFTCEFCLSSLDVPVRQVPLPAFLGEMQQLLDRGVRQFKFVDRTFNLNIATSRAILEFFLERHQPGRFFHFEMIPDRLPDELRELIARFPPGSLQFEVGIQTFNAEVCERISRKQNYDRLEDNFRFLRKRHRRPHPCRPDRRPARGKRGELRGGLRPPHRACARRRSRSASSSACAAHPSPGTPTEWQMLYSPHPPYEILQNSLIDFATMQRLRRFARYWDLVGNSGNFIQTAPLIWMENRESGKRESENEGAGVQPSGCPDSETEISKLKTQNCETFPLSGFPTSAFPAAQHPSQFPTSRFSLSAFAGFLAWSDWLYNRTGRTDSIALLRLMELLFEYLTHVRGLEPRIVAQAMWHDYQRGGRKDKPEFLGPYLIPIEHPASSNQHPADVERASAPKRQARHLATG